MDLWGHLWPPTPIAKMQWFSGTRPLCRWIRMLLHIIMPEQGSSAATTSMIWVCVHIPTNPISALSNKGTKHSAEECTKQSQSTETASCGLKTLGWTNLTSSIYGKCWSFSKTSIMCRSSCLSSGTNASCASKKSSALVNYHPQKHNSHTGNHLTPEHTSSLTYVNDIIW